MINEISFDDINPYVRYVGYREINSSRIARWMAARDNRLFWCTKGQGTMLFQSYSNIHVVPNTLVIIPAGIPYCFSQDFVGGTVFLSINYDYLYNSALGLYQVGTVSTNIQSLQKILRHTFSDCPILNAPFSCIADETTQELLYSQQKEYFNQRLHYHKMLSSSLLSILVREIRNTSKEVLIQSNYAPVIDKMIDFVKAHYSENLSLEMIASYMGYQKDYINRLMRLHTDQTIYQYLQTYRINRAAQLIRSTNLSCQEIAELVGFLNASHFSRSFKKITGKTPREFKTIK